jgi:hypothetical protein
MKPNASGGPRRVFRLFLVKPSHYDQDGYVIQWRRTDIPSNTMAVLNGIVLDCIERRVLGEDVDIEVTAVDETNTRIKPDEMIREIQACGGMGLVGLVGVQSNQFPRAVDIARPLRAANIPVCIGGFHVSGCLSMLPYTPPDIQEAMDLGISIFAGEAEGRLGNLLNDVVRGEMKPLYNYMADLPGLEGAEHPNLPDSLRERSVSSWASFDSGRGCPFQCSFCTIINVQGRKSRYRTADDIEGILRAHYARGIKRFFISDDNFARNRNWEAIFDRIIKLREKDGLKFQLIIQVDTLCHKIANFVEKAGRAGVNRVFIGLENINPDNLTAAKKKQNRITEYRTMLQAWKSIGALTWCGYIIGFPNDTRERVMRDIEIIKHELPVDLVEFFCLTPLPGSEDHKVLDAKGVWMDPDMNIYDTEHVTTAHPLMSPDEFRDTYQQAWHAYYTPEHMETIMRRSAASGIKPSKVGGQILFFYGSQAIEGIHPLQSGILRYKHRRDRRFGLPIENPIVFYSKFAFGTAKKWLRIWSLLRTIKRLSRRVENDPSKESYTDLALTPAVDEDLDTLDIFGATESGKDAVKKYRPRVTERVPTIAAE